MGKARQRSIPSEDIWKGSASVEDPRVVALESQLVQGIDEVSLVPLSEMLAHRPHCRSTPGKSSVCLSRWDEHPWWMPRRLLLRGP